MSLLTIVLVHKEAQECFDRHLPYWKQWTDKILVVTPEDSQIQTTERQISYGKACHVGEEAVKRMRWMLRWIEGTDFTEFIIHEYDSIAFDRPSIFNSADPGADDAIQGNWFDCELNRDWLSTCFVHPPLAFRKPALHALVAALGSFPDHCERGAWDRWMGLAVKSHGMYRPSYGLNAFGKCGYGFSQNTIHENQYGDLALSVQRGARFFHGVKTEACLKVILENMK